MAAAGNDPPGGRDHLLGQVPADHGGQRRHPGPRRRADLLRFAEKLNIPVANTFMAKGVIPFSHPLWLGAVGLQCPRLVACGFDRADVIICVGYDMVEYHASRWHPEQGPADRPHRRRPGRGGRVLHRRPWKWSATSARRWRRSPTGARPQSISRAVSGRRSWTSLSEYADDASFPLKPQRLVWDLAAGVGRAVRWWSATSGPTRSGWPACISPSDPTPASSPTVLRPWGSPCPGRSPPSSPFPTAPVVAVTGDAGFMMNSQEIETALRIGTPIVIVIWNDNGYGLIEWHQLRRFGRTSYVRLPESRLCEIRGEFRGQGIPRRRRPTS